MEQGVAKKIKSVVLSGLLLGGVIAVSAAPAEAQSRRSAYQRSRDWDRDGKINRRDRDDDNDGIRDRRDRNDRSRPGVRGRVYNRGVYTRSYGRYDVDRDGVPDHRDWYVGPGGKYGTRSGSVRSRAGGWRGDIDGDGRINSRDRDRDGDGVRDRNDRYPNDRRRR